MSCCSLLRHLPPALKRLLERLRNAREIVIVCLSLLPYCIVPYLTLPYLFLSLSSPPSKVIIVIHGVGYTSQITAGGLLHYTGLSTEYSPKREGGSPGGWLSFCHPVGLNLRSNRHIKIDDDSSASGRISLEQSGTTSILHKS